MPSRKSKKSKKPPNRRPSAPGPSRSGRAAETVRAERNRWHQQHGALEIVEAVAGEDPAGVAEHLLEFARWEARRYARYARMRFGVEAHASEGEDRAFETDLSGGRLRFTGPGGYRPVAALSVVRPEREPRDLLEYSYLDELLVSYSVPALALRAMFEIGSDVHKAGYRVEDMAWTMCQVFTQVYRLQYVFAGAFMRDPSLPSALREFHAARLGGWAASNISLQTNKRVSAALAGEEGGAHEALLRELPAAIFVCWDDARGGKDLVRAVSRSLENLGREAATKPKVQDAPASSTHGGVPQGAGVEDPDLTEFEIRETLRVDLQRLRRCIEEAELSGQELRVYELDQRTDFDTKTVARELGITADTARQYRKRYHDKLRRANEASGF